MTSLRSWRRWAFGLSTLLGRPRGFFIPYRHAGAVAPPLAYDALMPRFVGARPRFLAGLRQIATYLDTLKTFASASPPAPRWSQDWFAHLDGAYAYATVRAAAPRRIVEVGSGHSTRFMARAIQDTNAPTLLTCIDPAPRASLRGLNVTWHNQRLEQSGFDFSDLVAGDILFIDSSHILMPGSDVDHVLGRVLPTLARGVRIHFHDIFLPDPYPLEWTWRGYNEQNAVAALLAGDGFTLDWGSAWIARHMQDDIVALGIDALPRPPGAYVSSLWLTKS